MRNADIVDEPSGRPRVETPGGNLNTDNACTRAQGILAAPIATERRALDQLGKLVNGCLARRDVPSVRVGPEHTWAWVDPRTARTGQDRDGIVAGCLAASRRDQLAPFVAPAALLFVTTPDAPAPSAFDLSPANRARIVAVTAVVLLVAIGATGRRGQRP